ncbi:MAG: ComEC/Rec2 family competence protein [Patescibacteria group bacterium]|nr:ComEC/Rec2 family competence protein [Patescibacteria group bacterium]
MLNARKIFFLSIVIFLFTHWFYRYCKTIDNLPKERTRVQLRGMVATVPKRLGTRYVFDLQPVRFAPESPFKVKKITVYASLESKPTFGEWLLVEGLLNPKGYISFPRIENLKKSRSPFVILRGNLFKLRRSVGDLIAAAVPEPEAGLLKGILLGIKDEISADWEDIYRKVGVTHVVVASGYNVTVLIGVVSAVIRPLGTGFTFIFSTLAIALFTLMLGAEPPILRAALMGFVASMGNLIGRRRDVLRTLFFTGFLLLFINPRFINSISFQLSFASSLGLVVLVPWLEKIFDNAVLSFLMLKEDLVTTIAAFLFVFPVVSFHFGKISPASFLVNTITLWTIPPAMLFGFITVLTAMVSRQLGRMLGAFSWIFLKFFNCVAFRASQIFEFWQIRMSLWAVALYYILLFVLWFLFQNLGRVKQKD